MWKKFGSLGSGTELYLDPDHTNFILPTYVFVFVIISVFVVIFAFVIIFIYLYFYTAVSF